MKRRLITKHNTIKKTFLRHCILQLNAKVTSVDVVCRFQKLQQLKTVGLPVQSLSQHRSQSYLTSPIHDSHGAQISSGCEEDSLVPRFLLTHAAVLHFFLYKGTPLSVTADTSVECYWERGGSLLNCRRNARCTETIDSCFANCSAQNAFYSRVAIIALLRHRLGEKRGVGLRMCTKLEHLPFRSMWETYTNIQKL